MSARDANFASRASLSGQCWSNCVLWPIVITDSTASSTKPASSPRRSWAASVIATLCRCPTRREATHGARPRGARYCLNAGWSFGDPGHATVTRRLATLLRRLYAPDQRAWS